MKRRAFATVLTFSLVTAITAHAQTVLQLWPRGTPESAQTTEPEKDVNPPSAAATQTGNTFASISNITEPTLTIYPPFPNAGNNGAGALVFPGGGYTHLAWNKEGLETCRWLNSIGLTCFLVKYRVPETGRYPDNLADLEDAQQAMRLARAHAGQWDVDPDRIGVVGFSAGGNLAVLLSNHFDDRHIESTSAARDIPRTERKENGGVELTGISSARPDFVILGYPAYLAESTDKRTLDPVYTPNTSTPPTFLIQAENDHTYIDSSLVYFRALKDANVPAELHLYATGGHGFGMHPVGFPEEHWSRTATDWLRSIGMLSSRTRENQAHFREPPTPVPCPSQQVPIGRPSNTPPPPDSPPCW
jgi:acetyl esterase/lipase